ncbi:ABC transporter permease [Kroppenstedtia eburnea]|uniref:ABC transporter permease n=1 Tax=Kroppenstedtia eburnea TaxID=714067 RepID=UPI00362A4451
MIRIIRSEWQRMWARKKTKVLLFGYLGLLLLMCRFLSAFKVSFYDPAHDVSLNSLNTAPFLFRELSFFLVFILVPLLAVDSFNGETRSGALRMVLIRPLARWRILAAKWALQAIVLAGLLAVTMWTGILFGMWVMPDVATTSFYKTETFGFTGAMGYIIQYYSLGLLILMTVSGAAQLISLWMPNAVFSYAGVIAFLIGGIYVSPRMEFLLMGSDSIFKQLAPSPEADFIGLALGIVTISLAFSFLVWTRRDFKG